MNPLFDADVNFPNLNDKKDVNEKLNMIQSYLYIMMEALRYSFSNIDKTNFNESGLMELSGEITKPLTIRISQDEETIAEIAITQQGLSTRMTNAEGNISTLEQTASGLSTTVSQHTTQIADRTTPEAVNNLTTQILQRAGYIQATAVDEKLSTMNSRLESRISSSVIQSADSIQAKFDVLSRNVDDHSNYITRQSKTVTQDVNGLTVSNGALAVKGVFGNDDLQFKLNDTKLATFGANGAEVDKLKANEMLFSKWQWKDNNGVLSLYYIGG